MKGSYTEKDWREFTHEVEVMRSIKPHPHVMSMIGVCSIEPPYCIITEFMDGGVGILGGGNDDTGGSEDGVEPGGDGGGDGVAEELDGLPDGTEQSPTVILAAPLQPDRSNCAQSKMMLPKLSSDVKIPTLGSRFPLQVKETLLILVRTCNKNTTTTTTTTTTI